MREPVSASPSSSPSASSPFGGGGAFEKAGAQDALIGQVLDERYFIEAVLGEGGMGVVYRARHVVLQRPLAIKVLRPDVSKNQEVMQRFQQEAQSASAIGNEHIIDITDFGRLSNGATYFVMEFLDGRPLGQVIEKEAPLPPIRVVRIGKQISKALGAAHARDIVHRDLKPDNIFLIKRGEENDFVKVLDFGIAKVGGSGSKLTQAGQVFGTPHYMSPEQCLGRPVDARTDIYSLGVILFEMATGRLPFDADNIMGILSQHIHAPPPSPRSVEGVGQIPPSLEAVILKCLAKAPEERYTSMEELRAVLEGIEEELGGALPRSSVTTRRIPIQVAAEPPQRKNKPLLIALAGLVVLGLGAGVAVWARTGKKEPKEQVAKVGDRRVGDKAAPSSESGMVKSEAGEGGSKESEEGRKEPAGSETGEKLSEKPSEVVALVRIESIPQGALVYHEGKRLGVTPLEIPRPQAGQPLSLVLRLGGYMDEQIVVTENAPPLLRRELERLNPGPGKWSKGGGINSSEREGLLDPWEKTSGSKAGVSKSR
ncbi:MAG: protein kinase [Sandaracinaceae bacterium]|nr:protein kinase [Sandaracinaceae bacterium]MDW8245340.1 serine/threonine-protein kinase [Sandaracinaceae bacterium]